jgi:hypothetical protein
MQELKSHALWRTFDLRLDVALLQLHSASPPPSLSHYAFLEQSVKTLRHLISVQSGELAFPSQLTMLPTVLMNPDLQEAACEVVALYLDKSVDAIRQAMLFPLFMPLFRLFSKRIGGDFTVLAVAKIVCFMPDTSRVFYDWCPDVFGEWVFPLFAQQKPLFPVIVATLLARGNPVACEKLSGRWEAPVLPLLAHDHSDVRVWALLFISTIAPRVSDRDVAIDPVLARLSDDAPDVRVAALHALSLFAGHPQTDAFTSAVSRLARQALRPPAPPPPPLSPPAPFSPSPHPSLSPSPSPRRGRRRPTTCP